MRGTIVLIAIPLIRLSNTVEVTEERKRLGKQRVATRFLHSPQGLAESSLLELLPRQPRAQSTLLGSHLHPVHGLPELVELVGRAECFQADVRQLHLLVSQLISELHDCLGFAIHALRDSRERGNVTNRSSSESSSF